MDEIIQLKTICQKRGDADEMPLSISPAVWIKMLQRFCSAYSNCTNIHVLRGGIVKEFMVLIFDQILSKSSISQEAKLGLAAIRIIFRDKTIIQELSLKKEDPLFIINIFETLKTYMNEKKQIEKENVDLAEAISDQALFCIQNLILAKCFDESGTQDPQVANFLASFVDTKVKEMIKRIVNNNEEKFERLSACVQLIAIYIEVGKQSKLFLNSKTYILVLKDLIECISNAITYIVKGFASADYKHNILLILLRSVQLLLQKETVSSPEGTQENVHSILRDTKIHSILNLVTCMCYLPHSPVKNLAISEKTVMLAKSSLFEFLCSEDAEGENVASTWITNTMNYKRPNDDHYLESKQRRLFALAIFLESFTTWGADVEKTAQIERFSQVLISLMNQRPEVKNSFHEFLNMKLFDNADGEHGFLQSDLLYNTLLVPCKLQNSDLFGNYMLPSLAKGYPCTNAMVKFIKALVGNENLKPPLVSEYYLQLLNGESKSCIIQ